MTTGIDLFYITQPVDNADQAVSLAEYLNQHGVLAYKEANDSVIVPMQCADKEAVADRSSTVYALVQTWKLFWEHSDRGLYGLPIYSKD